MDITGFQKLLASILAGIETRIDHVPEDKVPEGSKVFGTINDPVTRALYSLFVRVGQYFIDYRTANAPVSFGELHKTSLAELRKHNSALELIDRLRDAVRFLIWVRIGIEIPETMNTQKSLLVFRGWQIAESGKEEEDDEEKPKISVLAVAVPVSAKPRVPIGNN